MEYNQPSLIVKDLNFGKDAKGKVIIVVTYCYNLLIDYVLYML